ncbi:hypothetical protein COCMIDRAFT_35348 [Bipolaris oryzae ATCC 44560]|uniref:Aquaporin n=1 Tax=Bipolaris oryzae ATCC 44560 TaxID=930090 RepID=W6ZAN6_COCMI|nr:uncharacterized protein COCMIDRAFT_35348 [Bipolaris oryzae ATCC 44560]EUC47045.1 hypothetical protein COCMIDRAFT_35348 [Bipolaris oryzae ATCC 44560]
MPTTVTGYSADPTYSGERRHGLRGLSDKTRHLLIAFLGELIGTFLFLFFAFAGTQVANNVRKINGNSNMDLASLLYISLSFGFSLAVTVWVFFRISGGLFNPAVTVALSLAGAFGIIKALLLIVAQFLGAIIAAAIVSGLLPGPLAVNTTLSSDTSVTRGLFIEMFLTFMLLLTIFMLAAEKHRATFLAPLVIGLALFIAELAGVYFTGASLNPARSFGPAVITGVWPGHHWIYWLGPLLGALLAVGFYKLLRLLNYSTANPDADSDGLEKHLTHRVDSSANRYDTTHNARYAATDGTEERGIASQAQLSERQPVTASSQPRPSVAWPPMPTSVYIQALNGHRSETIDHPNDRPRAHHTYSSSGYEISSDSSYRSGPSAESGSLGS